MKIKRLKKHRFGFHQPSRKHEKTYVASTTVSKEGMQCLHAEAKLRHVSVSAILAELISSRYSL